MADWRSTTFSEVVTLQRGHDLPATSRGAGNVPVIGSFGITGYHDVAKHAGPGVAIGRSGASIGVATYCPRDYWPLNTCLFVKDFKGNDPRWIYYLLDSIDFSAYNSGSAQPSLNRNYLANIPVDLPTVAEQRFVAATLGALDDKIQSNRRKLYLLLDLARARYQRLCKQTQGWVPLATGYSIGLSGVWGADSPTQEKSVQTTCLRGRDLDDYTGQKLPMAPVRFISPAQLTSRTPMGGEIWTAGSGTLGPSLLITKALQSAWSQPITYSNFVKRLIPDGGLAPELAWLAVDAAYQRGDFKNFRTGTAMPNLDPDAMLRGVRVPVADPAAVQAIRQLALLALDPQPLLENRRLRQLREALAPGLLSGFIRLPRSAA